ncbi:MAG: beta-lactamase family protein [Deltaproteobacteria bacterium]|nr:beta-lactamase family protein [Deltaproteobacteria bacterium]
MKRRFLLVLAFALLSCSDNTVYVPIAQSYSAAIQEAQDAAYEVTRAGGTSVGIALVTRDKVVLAGGYGMADVDKSLPATENTMFPIGSVSKMFAAVAVMQLVDRGLVNLEDPLVKHLPTFRMADARYDGITVRMLLNHTSGIAGSRYTSGETSVAVPGYAEAVLASLADQRLKADPGTFAVYCNDGWTLCDPLVAAVTKMSYRDWVKQEIIEPLGMKNTTFSLAPLPDGAYAKAYQSGVALPQEYINVDAAGGIYSTPADMAAFVRMFLNEGKAEGGAQILTKESVEAMGVDQTVGTFNPVPYKGLAYGLGWDTVTQPGLGQAGVKGWTKNGGTFYYAAQILVAPEEGLAAVALGPAGGGYLPLAIVERVLMRALVEKGSVPLFPKPLAPRAEPVATAPDGLTKSTEGIYASHNHVYQLKAEADGSLTMRTLTAGGFPKDPASVLRYRTDGWFTSDAAPLISFKAVSGGTNRYLAVRSPGADKSYLDTLAYAQKVTAKSAGLSSAWIGRIGKHWLVVNEHPAGLPFFFGEDPRFRLMTFSDLPGSLFAIPALPPMGASFEAQAVDASVSDQRADMMLQIPGIASTDMNTLDIVVRGEEEWLRWGGYYHRPLEKVLALSAATTSPVAIGPEGYAEWRSVQLGKSPISVSISGASAWRLYDKNFKTLASGGASGRPELPSRTETEQPELAYLMLFGDPGSSVMVTVP